MSAGKTVVMTHQTVGSGQGWRLPSFVDRESRDWQTIRLHEGYPVS
jgi:hypothetical protein